jgi:hypothetical protein
MQNIDPAPQPRNPIAELIAEAIALAVTRPEVIEALRAVYTPPAPVESAPVGLLSKQPTAKAIGISTTTLDRFVAEGAPVHHVGARRMFDISELRTWLDARGRKPANAKPRTDSVDVDDVLSRSGLRLAGGAK